MGTRRAGLRRLLIGAVIVALAGLAAPTTSAPSTAVSSYDAADAPRTVTRDKCGRRLVKPGGGTWRCSFVDNFGRSSLNRSKWIIQHTSNTGFHTGRTCYRDSPENLALRNGTLVLTARKGRWVNCRFGPRGMRTRFTGGMIGTKGKFSQMYGRFEVRARFPENDTGGVHGGFWMYPVNLKYGRWPASGEIDVAEWWSYDRDLVLPSLHYEGRDPDVDSGWDCKVENVSEFHTYTAIWEPSVIQFLIDGRVCFSRSWTPAHPLSLPQPFDHRFSMILNVGVLTQGLTWRTVFPAEFVVDYAKAWR